MATETRAFKCPKCGHDVVVDLPPQTIVNLERASMILVVHESVPVCNNCNQAFMYAMEGANIRHGWVAVEFKQEESGIILPPGARAQ